MNWWSFHGTSIAGGAGRDSRLAAGNLRVQRRDEPAHTFIAGPACVARAATGKKVRWADDRDHVRASPQRSSFVAEEFRAASEVSSTARSRPLHHETGCCGAPEKRRAVPADVDGR